MRAEDVMALVAAVMVAEASGVRAMGEHLDGLISMIFSPGSQVSPSAAMDLVDRLSGVRERRQRELRRSGELLYNMVAPPAPPNLNVLAVRLGETK